MGLCLTASLQGTYIIYSCLLTCLHCYRLSVVLLGLPLFVLVYTCSSLLAFIVNPSTAIIIKCCFFPVVSIQRAIIYAIFSYSVSAISTTFTHIIPHFLQFPSNYLVYVFPKFKFCCHSCYPSISERRITTL